jgi:hypothetical protein
VKTDYTEKGIDQFAEVIYKLKNNLYNRRIILSAWNPTDLKFMALPLCHIFARFRISYLKNEGGAKGQGRCIVNFTRRVVTWDWEYRLTLLATHF